MATDYSALGIKPVINAAGNMTFLGGSLMPPEVIAAWVEASKQFVNLYDLQDRVGERIAQLLNVEAALVTTGAAGAIFLGTAAVISRGDPALIKLLPDTTGAKHEVILQRAHHSEYDSQFTAVGAKLIEVDTLADIERCINPRTALMFFMNYLEPTGEIARADWIATAKRHGIPTLIDASADVPPIERITEYLHLGFDLLAISGGKAIRGPNDTGLLLGRRDFIAAAKLNCSPHEPTIGRVLKVGKEDMMALLAAIERFVSLDHQAERAEMERRATVIETALQGIPAIHCERIMPLVANQQPHLIVEWNEAEFGLSRKQLSDALLAGDPPIQLSRVAGTGDRGILISVLALQTGEEQIVAERLREIFLKRH